MRIQISRDDKVSEGEIERHVFSSQERTMRGLRVSGIFLAVAFLTVFVPVLHFVLPPVFILAAIVFGWSTWHDKAEIRGGNFLCPVCQAPNTLTKQSESFPLTPRCASCQMTLTINASEPSPKLP